MYLVKMITDDDGAEHSSKKWHLVTSFGGTSRTVCTGECFGVGESQAIFKEKHTTKGGITCPECLKIIKWYKAIKL